MTAEEHAALRREMDGLSQRITTLEATTIKQVATEVEVSAIKTDVQEIKESVHRVHDRISKVRDDIQDHRDAERKERKSDRRWAIGLAVTLATALSGIVGTVILIISGQG